MQQHYLGVLPETVRADLVRNVVAIRAACAERGVPVFATVVPQARGLMERGLMWDLWGRGPRGEGADLDPALTVGEGRLRIVTKRSYSAFYGTDFEVMLRRLGRDSLIVAGVYTSIGCLCTAFDAFERDMRAFIVADATADMSAADHQTGLRNAARLCARVVSAEELRRSLSPETPPVDRHAAIDVC